MTAAALFLFPDSFEDRKPASPPPPAPPPEPVFTQAEIAAAHEAGVAAGAEAAREKAAAEQADSVAALLATIAQRLDDAAVAAAEVAERSAMGMAKILFAALGAAFPSLSARYGEAEIRRVAATVLPGLSREPGVIVRVHPQHAAALGAAIAALPTHLGTPPRIEATEKIAIGDVVILWEDGRAVRDGAAAWSAITAILNEAAAE